MSVLTLEQLLSSSKFAEEEGDEEVARRAMYLPDKPRQIDFYKNGEMMIEVAGNGGLLHQQQQQMVLPESSVEDHEVKAPKKRAETWVQEETRSLISFRREMDGLFNTSKSNKHLWEQISAKMRDKGFDRSPTMCTDKWRNLLKEFKKAKHQYKGSGSAKMSYYKELDELLKERGKNAPCKSTAPSKVDPYLQFSEKGFPKEPIQNKGPLFKARPRAVKGVYRNAKADKMHKDTLSRKSFVPAIFLTIIFEASQKLLN